MNFQELMQKMVELDKPKTTNERVETDETVEEGAMKDIDYNLRLIANEGDEEDVIDGLAGLKGPELQLVLQDMMDEVADHLASKGMNHIINDEDKMIEVLFDKIVDDFSGDGDEDDGQPSSYDEYQDLHGGDDWDHGQYEGNEFSGALAKAKASGESEFEVDGKRYQVKEDGSIEECGMMGGMGPSEPMKQQDSVTMNVNMSGSGKGGIRDLLDVLRNIENETGDVDSGPDVLVKKDSDDMPPELKSMGMALDDDFANEPDEMYKDIDSMMQTGDDLHSKGAEAPKVNGGGNPRQITSGTTFSLPKGDLKIKLENLYNEIKNR